MTDQERAPLDVDSAPEADSREFLAEQNTAEKVSPGTTADAPATDAALISTDPAPAPGTDQA